MEVVAKVMELDKGERGCPQLFNVHVIVDGKVVASVWGSVVRRSKGMVQVSEKGNLVATIYSHKVTYSKDWEPVDTGSQSSVTKNVRLGMEEW